MISILNRFNFVHVQWKTRTCVIYAEKKKTRPLPQRKKLKAMCVYGLEPAVTRPTNEPIGITFLSAHSTLTICHKCGWNCHRWTEATHHTMATAASSTADRGLSCFHRERRASLAASQDTTQRQLLPNSFHYIGSISLDKRSKQRTRAGFTVLLPPAL